MGNVQHDYAAVSSPIRAAGLVAALDLLLVLVALGGVLVAGNFRHMPHGVNEFLSMRVTLKNLLLVAFLGIAALTIFRAAGLYDAARLRRWTDETRRALLACALLTLAATVIPLSSASGAFHLRTLAAFWALASAGLVLGRSVRAALTGRAGGRKRVLIVGTGPQALRIHREICAAVREPCQVLGFVDTTSASTSPFVARRTLGSLAELEPLLVREHIDEVFIGLPVKSQYPQIEETLRICERVGVKATYHADIFATAIARPRVQAAGAPALVEMQVAPEDWRVAVKRVADVAGAALALVAFSPVMLAAAIAIKVTSPGPVVFAQERYGLNRRRFRMFKFRTMVVDADKLQAALEARNEADGPVFKIARDPRVTRVGAFLRKTSIDELPQLVNVLRGDMSLVGPRPLPLRDVARFTRAADMRRFSVRPGLTCLWQVSGRSGIGFDEWIRLDLQYIDRWSLGLDLSVLARTVPAVLRGTGAT